MNALLLIGAALVCGILAWGSFEAAKQVDPLHPHHGPDIGRTVDGFVCTCAAMLLVARLFIDMTPLNWITAAGSGLVGLMLARSAVLALYDSMFLPHARRTHAADLFPVAMLSTGAGVALSGAWVALT